MLPAQRPLQQLEDVTQESPKRTDGPSPQNISAFPRRGGVPRGPESLAVTDGRFLAPRQVLETGHLLLLTQGSVLSSSSSCLVQCS